MFRKTLPRNSSCIPAICILALLLAVALSSAAAANGPPSGPSSNGPPSGPPGNNPPTRGPSTNPGGNPDPTPTRTPTRTPTPSDGNGGSIPPSTPTPSSPRAPGETLTLKEALAEYELIKALAPNRIIFHAATPIQLCKVEDGLQIYYVGRDGKTRLGPWVPGFAELAAKYPGGPEASIYFGFNPLTGKRVKIDYLPSAKRIRVDTFYADKEHDKNKQYIFHFGPDHDITYDAW